MNKIGIENLIPIQILKIAQNVRRWLLRDSGGDSKGMCYDASLRLLKKLKKNYRVKMIDGEFCVDNYDDGQEYADRYHHFWIVVRYRNNDYILDTTADQFNDDMIDEKMASIVFGTEKKIGYRYVDSKRKCYLKG